MTEHSRIRSERGAVTIHVAIALTAIIAFSAIVIDHGVMWVSRRQAQNAADAGALAGAVSMIRDSGTIADATASARQFANTNPIWGLGNSTANVDVAFSGPSLSIVPCGVQTGCIRVDVFRNTPDRTGAIRGATIPTYFAPMFGLTAQGVRATATAKVGSGNAVRCLLPFAVIDRWADNYDANKDGTYWRDDPLPGISGWSNNDQYEESLGDVYIGPYNGNTDHTGWKVDFDYGRQLVLKFGNAEEPYSSGWSNTVNLPGSIGGDDYREDIQGCNDTVVGIAQESEPCAPAPGGDTTGREINGCISVSTGVQQGPTVQGISTLVNRDSGAYWNWGAKGALNKDGAVIDSTGVVNMSSPRIRPIVIVDIDHYIAAGCSGTTCIAKVANIIGFFVEGMCNDVKAANKLDPGMDCENPSKDVVGRIVTLPGMYATSVGDVEASAAFVQVVQLVR